MDRLIRAGILIFSGLFIIATGGCARSITISPPSLNPLESAVQFIADDERVPFFMDTFRSSLNGAPQNPSSGLERRILNRLQETRLFSALIPLGTSPVSSAEKMISARMTFDETMDPHPGQTALKGFLVGASMFLLSPIIELNYDYAAQASLELERWDGQVKRYEAHSSGIARYNLFGATPIMIDELKGRVTEACLAELMDHLVRDTDLYLASSASLPNSSIRTMTVKAKRPSVSEAASTVIPASRSSTP